jgi:hypothetical protein
VRGAARGFPISEPSLPRSVGLVTREGLYGQDGVNDMFVEADPGREPKSGGNEAR